VLTDAGQAILQQSQQIVGLLQNLSVDIDDVTNLRRGRLRLGMPPIAASTVFPRVLGEFNKAFPNIGVELYEFGTKKIEEAVLDGTLDAGVVCSPPAKPALLAVYSCIRDPLRVIVHPVHRLAALPAVDFAMLADEPFVLYPEDFSLHDRILERCRQAGFQPRVICETSQREFMTEMVAADLGVALLPGEICDRLDPAAIAAVPLCDPQLCLELSIIRHKDRYLSFAARQWLEFTAATLGLTPAEGNG
jgi:DNA-binding transcriptional LysR family regulator